MNIQVLRSKHITEQQYSKSAFLGKPVAQFRDEVIGSWVVVVCIDGFTVSGNGATEQDAIESAKSKWSEFQ